MKTRELRVIHGNQESFYKKAFVKEDAEGTQYLYSYYSLIITNYGKAMKFEENLNLYTNTTLRHVREYLKQIGNWQLAALPKAKLFKKLAETEYIILDMLQSLFTWIFYLFMHTLIQERRYK